MRTEQEIKLQAVKLTDSMDLEQLVVTFESMSIGNGKKIEEAPTVRGWVIDELEKRNPVAFEEWVLSNEDSPRRFFLK